MKKKPLTTYPSIPAPKVDQFTLPQLANQLLRSKEFVKGLQGLFSNCIITKSTTQPMNSPISSTFQTKSILSPTASSTASKRKQKLSSSLRQASQHTQEDECEFIFQHQVKNRMMYPWMIGENGRQQMVECKIITEQVTDFLQQAIQCSLHKILNKEFINVTNQILAMREEISVFTKEELERSQLLKVEVHREVEKMQKKLQQQQHISTSILNQPLEKFSRSKAILNSSMSNNSTKESNKFIEDDTNKVSSIHHEVFSLKKQVDSLKKSTSSSSQFQKSVNPQIIKHLQQRQVTMEQKLSDLTLSVKLNLQEHRQKWRKGHQQLCSQLATNTSKQYISLEVKKSVKSNLKIYLEEIMKCKNNIQDLYDRIQRNDKAIQDYIGNQLKNVWHLVSGIKTRVENIQDQCNVGMDQSFVL